MELISSLTYSRIEDVNDDICLNDWGLRTDIREYRGSVSLLKLIDLFYFLNGRFSPEKEVVLAPDGDTPKFFKESEKILPKRLYELYSGSSWYGLVSIRFLSALNVYLGAKREISKNAMSEFFDVTLSFEEMTELVKKINHALQNRIDKNEGGK